MLHKEVERHFRPEFLNRIDEIIIFQNLTPDQIGAIVEIQVERLARRLAERKITLRLTDEAKRLIGRKGYDPVYGARPLKRAIQQSIENPLAVEILKGRFPEDSEILADAEGDRITFSRN
jgi:ATP-dependent Clp protease ATP-binding subunit ClpB